VGLPVCSGCSAPRTITPRCGAAITARTRQDTDRHDLERLGPGSSSWWMDGAYASKAWRGLPEGVSVTTRCAQTPPCTSSQKPNGGLGRWGVPR